MAFFRWLALDRCNDLVKTIFSLCPEFVIQFILGRW